MSKVWKCKCNSFIVSDIEYTSIKFEPQCPNCGRKWSTFYSCNWLPKKEKQNEY